MLFWAIVIAVIAVVLLVFIGLCALALVGWARLAVGVLNNISELLLEQQRWPASNSTLRPSFKTDNSHRAN